MSAVELNIVQPTDQAIFQGGSQVAFIGQVGSLPEELIGVELYYRWYSSLFPAEEDRYSININALTDPGVPFYMMLNVGTHVITFAASDQSEETKEAQNATQHGGVTGGAEGEGKCIIHVFRANLIYPDSDGVSLSKTHSTLKAEAPLQWGKKIAEVNYEPNSDYHSINRIRYRWRFEPLGPPAGRHSADLVPTVGELIFDPESDPVMVQYTGTLPNVLDIGNYILTLRVEDIESTTVGDEVSRQVIITG